MAEELKEVEIPLGEVTVLLRPKEEKHPLSYNQVRKMLNFINDSFQKVKGTTKPLIVFIPSIIEVIVIDSEGKVEVY